jgi:lysophospholipase L1-like esterase
MRPLPWKCPFLIAVLGSVLSALAVRPANAETQPVATPPAGPQAAAEHARHRASAANPVPRGDPNSMLAHEQLVAKAHAGRIDAYFLGDSITRRWGCSDSQWAQCLVNWGKNFYGWNAGNFGWGADSIQHILWRIEHGELDGVNPKVIVILAGTNNIGNHPGGPDKVEDIALGLKRLVETCRQKAPGAQIILTAIFPRNDNRAVLPEIEAVNKRAALLCDGKTVHFLNVNERLADAQGMLFPGMVIDGLHPSVQGYQVWADGLNPLLERILGPRASVDVAPPPTGDPSAAHPASGS